jgi:hypothetical protein
MAKQADLFTFDDDAEQTYPQRPGFVRDSDTSRAAADSFDESDLSRQKAGTATAIIAFNGTATAWCM